METNYDKQAQDFAAKHSLSMTATYKGHFPRLSEAVTAQFSITLTRGTSAYTFDFSDSINDTPSLYSILACLPKSDPGTFADFCDAYGYDTGSTKDHDLYFAVQDAWSNVNRLFSDCLEELQEIN